MRVEYDDVETEDDLRVTYQGQPFTGEVVERSSQNQVIAITTYFNGIEDGPSAEWYPTGERKAAGTVRYGMAVGVHEEWHRNGNLAARSEFDDQGNLLSRYRWAEDGTPLETYVAQT
ncbi:toxin-antitoxin system YwqK family antitoxin [Micromonospora sp. URMC 103]|uniref:toxin-antitoxin system YwqK family antitoxin n=1 Tax=Micromonospora sp. URMC 103 TaxID=3423406 RepID=UPI003F1DA363